MHARVIIKWYQVLGISLSNLPVDTFTRDIPIALTEYLSGGIEIYRPDNEIQDRLTLE